jgi:type 1 fimbria pilin
MRGIDEAEGVAEDGSTCEVSLVACGDVEVKGVYVEKFAGSGDRSGAVEAVRCEAKRCSTLTVDSDAPDNS